MGSIRKGSVQMIEQFFEAMKRELPDDGRIMMCQFRGDPNADIKGKWRAYVLNDVEQLDPRSNVYLCVSAMKKNARGEFRRRKDNFAGGLLLMIDDLGEGAGAKFPMSTIDAAPPTGLIETSPDNYQAVYLFDKLVTDIHTFDALIKAFIEAQFLGKDTGMAGVNRVFRPPAGVNAKPKHERDGRPWQVRLAEWHPERRYSPKELAAAFKLDLKRRSARLPRGATEDKAANIRAFVDTRNALRNAGMIKRNAPDMAGWTDMRCPWTENHTGKADNGAALRLPDADNRFFGGFKCHHGGCDEKGWRDLTEWLSEEHEVILASINENAPSWAELTGEKS